MMLPFLDPNSGVSAGIRAALTVLLPPTITQLRLGSCYLVLSASLSGSLCSISLKSIKTLTQSCCRGREQTMYPLYLNHPI